jgi:hypothetical protein
MIHVERARRALAGDDPADLVYAALEIRMAVEELFYALVPQYAEELPSNILERWQPRRIIEALLDCNPMVEQYQQITIGDRTTGGPVFSGTHTPATRQLLKDCYQQLGAYLHAPPTGEEPDPAEMRAFVESTLGTVEQHCRETTFIANGFIFLEHKCVCGRNIKRNLLAIGVKPYVKCVEENCQAVYDVQIIEGGSVWRLRHQDFKCGKCRVLTPVGSHRLKAGARFTCIGCQSQYDISIGPIASRREPTQHLPKKV